jgi:hypothetical protein
VVDLKDHPFEEEQSPAIATTIPEEKIEFSDRVGRRSTLNEIYIEKL